MSEERGKFYVAIVTESDITHQWEFDTFEDAQRFYGYDQEWVEGMRSLFDIGETDVMTWIWDESEDADIENAVFHDWEDLLDYI